MRRNVLILILLLACCFTLALGIEQALQAENPRRSQKARLMELLLGDSRRLLSQYLFTKADLYFHSGFYLSTYEMPTRPSGSGHVAGETEEHEEEVTTRNEPRDWIEAFGRKFYPSKHTHLDQGGAAPSGRKCEQCEEEHAAHDSKDECDDEHHNHQDEPGHAKETESSEIREILPWLKLAADLDPNRIETYTTAAYWLARRMNQPKEAEAFLREGLRQNPGDPSLLYELGQVALVNEPDGAHARNIWELALRKWDEKELSKSEPNRFLLSQIYAHLAKLEVDSGNKARAIEHFRALLKVSPNTNAIARQIEQLQASQPAN